MSEAPEELDKADIQQLITYQDMFERLRATITTPEMNPLVSAAVALQLAGGSTRAQALGDPIRGEIHLAIVSDTNANLSRFLSVVADLAPNATRINGGETTHAGLVGSTKGGTLSAGPLLDPDSEFAIIETAPSGKTFIALQQILDTGAYSFTKANFRDTVPATGAVLLGVNPKYGSFDKYEPLGDQLTLPPALIQSVDMVLLNGLSEKTFPDHIDPLRADVARAYIRFAREHDPEVPEEVLEHVRSYTAQTLQRLDEIDANIGETRFEESVVRFAQAHAKLQFQDAVTTTDVNRVTQLFDQSFKQRGLDPETGSFDADVVETGS
jgi:replicative DNA helicase Mcm